MKMRSGGRIVVSVDTVSSRPVKVSVKPSQGTASAISSRITAEAKTRVQRLENIIAQDWLKEVRYGNQLDELAHADFIHNHIRGIYYDLYHNHTELYEGGSDPFLHELADAEDALNVYLHLHPEAPAMYIILSRQISMTISAGLLML